MKLTIQLKLLPTVEQADVLLRTMAAFNGACDRVSGVAFATKKMGRISLHHEVYYAIREEFGLPAQLAARVIGKVIEVYRRDRDKQHTFREFGATVYDSRILSFKDDTISIATLDGREKIPFVCGEHQTQHLSRIRGEADLVCRDGTFFLLQTVEVEEPQVTAPSDYLGVDLGILNIASDSDGKVFSGSQINGLRHRHARLRAKLQSKGTRSAKRLLKKRRRKEQRFARNVNHVISKKLVAKAQGTGRGIALEDLKGIRSRITVRKPQRRTQHSWAFSQLRAFVEYKAKLAGVPVVAVNPRYTSQTCPNCGHIAEANRPSQNAFSCVQCGLSGLADTIAAENIRRAAVNQPNVEAAD